MPRSKAPDGSSETLHAPTAEQIRSRRLEAGLTQTEAAELVHTTCRTWQQWEADESSVTHRQMHRAFWELFLRKTLDGKVELV